MSGPAIDTIVGHAANPSSTLTNVTMNTGDSLIIRSFAQTDMAWIERIIRAGATSGRVRLTSPLLHDNVLGITFNSPENPTIFMLPQERGERVYPQDTLTLAITGGTAETDLAALVLYYSNLPGADARLHSWADIAPLIKHIKPQEVDVTNSATIGTWTDTVINGTDTQLHANTDYAVLGYVTDTNQSIIAVKGQETGNLRIGGPGTTATDDTSDYYVRWSERESSPRIPVINSANAGAIYVSTCDVVASSTPKVSLVLAELSSNLPS
jgi:hypothetical protein